MPLKLIFLALLSAAVGFLIGLPLGALSRGTRATTGAAASTRTTISPAATGTTRPQPPAAKKSPARPLSSLAARLEAMVAANKTIEWLLFDEEAAALLRALDTDALRSLALELVARSGEGGASPEAVRTAFMHWSARDPLAAWEAAVAAKGPHRANVLAGCLRAMCAADYFAALKRAEDFPDKKLSETLVEALESDARRFWQPERLARALAAMPVKDRPPSLLLNALSSWMAVDQDASLAFIRSLPRAERDEALSKRCQILTMVDRDEAIRLAATIEDPKHLAKAWTVIIPDWAMMDPDAAMSALESLPLETMDEAIFDFPNSFIQDMPGDQVGRIAARLAGRSRDAFLEAVFKFSSALPSHSRLTETLAAIAPTVDDGGRWVDSVMLALLRVSPENATSWAESLPPGRMRDHALAGIDPHFMDEDSATSLLRAASIGDDKVRHRAFTERVEYWLARDRGTTIEWLKGNTGQNLPPEEAEHWLSITGVKK